MLARGAVGLTALSGLVLFFKPLLWGIARALLLALRPRLSRDQLAARQQWRNSQAMSRQIAASHGPAEEAELRAMAARG